ncbi:MAG: hypothetical protein SH859_13590 [Hyphomicrobium aestuarii]|nr:hypothetical protein [Hyphomicrobium aestuarii]
MITTNADGQLRALVLPITHSAPQKGTAAIEIPMTVRRAIGLDSDRSWIVLAEWNEFVWPGPDLRPVPNDTGGNMAYGYLPREFFVRVRDEFVATVEVGRANRIARTE